MFTFACGSIEGLTLNQKRETITALKKSISAEVAQRRALKVAEKEQKAFNAAMKRELAISRAQARLQKLLDRASPVGKKAIKANKRPSACTVIQQEATEANAIALKFAAKKQSA
jgi:type II secretory pathway component PulJ